MTTRRGPSKKKKKKKTAKAPEKRDRREEIVSALYRCMAEKGFTAATLSDIAQAAGMSSSHLLYYFHGKDAILEALFKDECSRERAELEALPDEPSEALDAVADLFLNPKNGTKNDRVVMLDLAGQTIQNRALRKAQANHDRAVKKALAGVFKKTPRTAGVTAVDAAHSAYAMLNGLRTTSFFDSSLSGLQAHKLFRSTLYQLAGIANGRAKRATRAAS